MRRDRFPLIRIRIHHLAAFAAFGLVLRPLGAQEASDSAPHFASCRVPGVDESVRCGTMSVRENPAARAGRKIALHFVVSGPGSPSVQVTSAVLTPQLPAPGDFVATVDNPFFPLIPGTTFEYRSETEDGVETNTVEVTSDSRTIEGITATVVHDQVYLEGDLTEVTFDWYAQDRWGNVWYLGEDSCEIDHGVCVSTEGSWEAGVDGAQAGVLMWANPGAHKGETYRQELYPDVAEDLAKVQRLDATVDVPYGAFTGALETMEWSPLEPGVREHKYYVPGVGLVLEVQPKGGRVTSQLVEITPP